MLTNCYVFSVSPASIPQNPAEPSSGLMDPPAIPKVYLHSLDCTTLLGYVGRKFIFNIFSQTS
ncbi:hypothetical protein J23TS9_22590 [Paenibacillus sp. J23TS9]|nr:hypothetical protein J23TS9_22590 [Paenibacillus sp. J23TS9]